MNLNPVANPLTRSRLRSLTRPAVSIVALAAIAPALTACGGGDAAASNPDVLRVGQLGSAKVTEALLEASGEDDGLDYTVEYSLFPGGGGGFLEAVPSGSVDLAQMADTPPIFGQVAGVETKVIGVQSGLAEGEGQVEIFAPADSGLDSMDDLKGKKVALTEGTILQYTVLKALEEAGLDYTDITAVNLTPPDALAAYQSGDVDAVAALGPQLGQLTLAGDTVIGDGVGITTGYSYSVATEAALDDDAKAANIIDFLQRVGRAQAWAEANQDEWIAIYAATLGVPEELARVLVEREDYAWVPIDDAVIAAQQDQADTYTDLGLIQEQLDVSEQFDASWNDELAGS